MKLLLFLGASLILISSFSCQNSTAQLTQDAHQDIDLEALEVRVRELINLERKNKRIEELEYQSKLSKLARNHSADMAIRDFVAHINPEGKSPTDRARDARFECKTKIHNGIFPTGIGENILMTHLYENYATFMVKGKEKRTYFWKSFNMLAEEIVESWMQSSGHRKNILRKDYHYEGLGIATNLSFQIFVTQNFC